MYKFLSKFFFVLTGILAIVVSILFFSTILNSTILVISGESLFSVDVYSYITMALSHGFVALVIFATLGVAYKINFIFRILIYIILAVIVVFWFFPETYAEILAMLVK